MNLIRVSVLIFFFFLNFYTSKGQAKNVLVIYSDDHSYHAIGAAGNREVKTPNIDKLAREGMMFMQAHVMGGHQGAVCIPSRVMMLTGRYVNRLPRDGGLIPDSIISLPEVLRAKGYTTYHTGKWHSDKMSHHRMFSDGGDIFLGCIDKDGGRRILRIFIRFNGAYPAVLKRNADSFSTTLMQRMRSNSTARLQRKPFFCYVASHHLHDPRTPPVNLKRHRHRHYTSS
jgi:arylsulfatase A-like enzyme